MVGNILCFIVSTGYPYKGTSLGSNSTGFLAISHLGATVRKRFPKEHRLVKDFQREMNNCAIFCKCCLLVSRVFRVFSLKFTLTCSTIILKRRKEKKKNSTCWQKNEKRMWFRYEKGYLSHNLSHFKNSRHYFKWMLFIFMIVDLRVFVLKHFVKEEGNFLHPLRFFW